MLNKIKNIIFRIMYLLIILYLVIFIPSLFGHKPLVVISGSMEPTLKVGGILYYENIKLEDYDTGDILVYKYDNHTISHRIVEITEDGFITKGDKNNTVDYELVKSEQILGKGTNWSIPMIGYYASFVYGHKYILYISIAIVFIDLCNDKYVEYKKKVNNEKDKE